MGIVHTITDQDLRITLKAAGFDAAFMQQFLSSWKEGNTEELMRMLRQKRTSHLDNIHRKEKQIDCLDYLVYQIEKGTITA